MAKNTSLSQAKKAKKDEFYTQINDIENELKHYKEHFRGKTILCNCDDPRISNFFRYFAQSFEHLGLKRLITTCYKSQDIDLFSTEGCEKAVYLIYDGDKNKNGVVDLEEIEVKPLKGNGDFRSQECIELLKQADIVVTNPPFSLFREYVAQLIEYNKKFLILARMSSLHYSEIFPLIKSNQIWVGYGFNLSMVYKSIYQNTEEANRKYVRSKGYDPDDNYIKVPAVLWYTNLDHTKRHEKLILYKKYSPDEYPKYDNYDAIDVNQVADIPMDYYGIMGVPDTLLGQFNPDQFELIGIGSGKLGRSIGITKNYRGRTDLSYTIDGVSKCPYSRILIRRKKNKV
ncbi:MAG: adenine-specific methyltransferase EcoRI family protein [Bacteroidales bacterium]|nr:adenine-specific methyltransferase EcoRI family protein [Candidatus Sodaliphilus limicaballi]